MAAPTLPDVSTTVSTTLEHADEAARAAAERLAAAGAHLRDQAVTARDEVRERVEDLRERVEDGDLEPVVRRARAGGWQLLRALVGAAAALTQLLPRGLRALSTVLEEVSERGADVGERARELVAVVPPSKRERRRSRLRTAAWAGAGFGVGLGVGWLLGRRADTFIAEESDALTVETPGADVSHNGPVGTTAAASDPGQRA